MILRKTSSKDVETLSRYLNWIQNSVFEGEISEVRLKELLLLAGQFMDKSQTVSSYSKMHHMYTWKKKL